MCGVKRFHLYLYRHSILQTDHEQLCTLFNHGKTLATDFEQDLTLGIDISLLRIDYRTSKNQETRKYRCNEPTTPFRHTANDNSATRSGTDDRGFTGSTHYRSTDSTLTRGMYSWRRYQGLFWRVGQRCRIMCVLEVWPEMPDDELRPFWTRRLELSVQMGMWFGVGTWWFQ